MTAAKLAIPIIGVLAVLGCSNMRVRQDPLSTAQYAGDKTALIEGCGHQPVAGYTYCRVFEGGATNQSLVFLAPPVKCLSPTCVYIKVLRPTGEPTLALSFRKGETRMSVPWSDLISRPTFEVEDRGFWPFVYQIKYLDQDGFERTLVTEGEIRLRVLKKDYQPLHETAHDPSFTWEFIEGGSKIKMTTGGRTYVSPSEKKP